VLTYGLLHDAGLISQEFERLSTRTSHGLPTVSSFVVGCWPSSPVCTLSMGLPKGL
jgi:hypothetical protein